LSCGDPQSKGADLCHRVEASATAGSPSPGLVVAPRSRVLAAGPAPALRAAGDAADDGDEQRQAVPGAPVSRHQLAGARIDKPIRAVSKATRVTHAALLKSQPLACGGAAQPVLGGLGPVPVTDHASKL